MLDIKNPASWPVLLSLRDVMDITHIGKNKALSLIQEGELPMTKLRGRYVISREGLMNWLKQFDGAS